MLAATPAPGLALRQRLPLPWHGRTRVVCARKGEATGPAARATRIAAGQGRAGQGGLRGTRRPYCGRPPPLTLPLPGQLLLLPLLSLLLTDVLEAVLRAQPFEVFVRAELVQHPLGQ